jgi:hypothetical protein
MAIFFLIVTAVFACIAYKEYKWAFLYRSWECSRCHCPDCQCRRCPHCNHLMGYNGVCTSCGWRYVPPPTSYTGDHGPAYPGQASDVDYTGLGGGGGGGYSGV